ncbi:histone-like transcription factor (CBF/NF-Y) and archaeal histone [Methanobrevibacter woesei]|uniref:Histone-like transcription factor (CBF/NF-Y) and archaeal histone n=1 Tax=Methanobrevibacter woesei TaxID=190976 RepID=A0A2U1S5H9_9EURY|nr:histone family protein [Methanobrevibacter woesei]MCI7292045.1 histone family protein [Methanobrevibacter woesei]PWB84793.1 histone-like transcription factor (CBF/NF-Y) and archaeal histone [Methanobrevibacter woesei]
MVELPKAPIERIMKNAGAERISDDAKVELIEYLEQLIFDITVESNKKAKIAKRKTIKADDIKLAIKDL